MTSQKATGKIRRNDPMRIHRTLVLGASLALVLGSAAVGEAQSALPSGPVGDGAIKVGSARFYESALVA